ncbi:DUF2149 domain-containing protein [Methanobrevibacter millerae]|uniref:DUF2149 domain-containing protein n=1 Tax=Methanobrevibacter millerae TaxID=230361 RepID=A0A1G5XBT0_9EURY|nr:DUF2149 domain-containing protein [Methanobrevibacter millerae]SDA67396.1 hypothetical protein SAMN02910315_02079 [Methanobrevibacter millerae]
MVRKKQRRRSNRVEEDPMAGTANLVDAMLVIAVGFLVFVIISWNMQSIVFNDDMTQEQKQQVMETISSVSEVTQGQELNETPDTSNSSGQGYTEMGKVYKDPSTGKLIMVEG